MWTHVKIGISYVRYSWSGYDEKEDVGYMFCCFNDGIYNDLSKFSTPIFLDGMWDKCGILRVSSVLGGKMTATKEVNEKAQQMAKEVRQILNKYGITIEKDQDMLMKDLLKCIYRYAPGGEKWQIIE